MKILAIYYTHKPGGFCKRLYRLLNALAVKGHSIEYLCLDQPPPDLSEKICFRAIPFPLRFRKGVIFWSIFTIWSSIYLSYRTITYAPDRIVVFGAYYGFLAAIAKIFKKTKIILFIRSLVFEINKITEKPQILCFLSNILERFGMLSADTLIAMSQAMKSELIRFMRRSRDIAVLANDVPKRNEISTALPVVLNDQINSILKQGKLLVLVSGVFDQRKNIRQVLDSFIELEKLVPNHQLFLLVAGVGPEISNAKKIVAQHKLSSVLFLGWIDRLDLIYPKISLVLHTSKHEGMPNSVLEAWSHTIPTFVAETPELKELAQDPMLWISGNDPFDLGNKLARFAIDSDYRNQLRKITATVALQYCFDWEQRAIELIVA